MSKELCANAKRCSMYRIIGGCCGEVSDSCETCQAIDCSKCRFRQVCKDNKFEQRTDILDEFAIHVDICPNCNKKLEAVVYFEDGREQLEELEEANGFSEEETPRFCRILDFPDDAEMCRECQDIVYHGGKKVS